jgi:hypothetical protein
MDYGMFSDYGNLAIESLVARARVERLTWAEVYRELVLISSQPDLGEATDTEVRERVFCALGFDKQNMSFYC